jgi:hypothetical protein
MPISKGSTVEEVTFVEASLAETWSATMLVTVTDGKGSCLDTNVPLNAKKVKLYWEMVTPGWEILGVHGLPYPMFTNKSKYGYDYKCKDKNNNPPYKDYKYWIILGQVVPEGDPLPEESAVILIDPTVRNGGVQ